MTMRIHTNMFIVQNHWYNKALAINICCHEVYLWVFFDVKKKNDKIHLR